MIYPPSYPPAVFNHLECLRRSYKVQRDIAMNRLRACEDDQDEEGAKIAELDVSLALHGLRYVSYHLHLAQAELANGSREVSR